MKIQLKIASLIVAFMYAATLVGDSLAEVKVQQSKAQKVLEKPLVTSWQPWYPYQYLKNETIQSSLTGLDIQLVNALAKEQGYKINYQSRTWEATITGLQTGKIDFAMSMSYAKEREAYVYYTKPYRFDEESLFVLRSQSKLYTFETVPEFLAYAKKNNFRLGVGADVVYADEMLNNYIKDSENSKNIIYINDKHDALKKLIANEIDGFFIDRIVGASMVIHSKYQDMISELYLNMRTPIRLAFSKKTVPIEVVSNFNEAIEKLSKSKKYENIISWYLYPVILLEMVTETWFRTIDILGTLFFSISGVLIARTLKTSIFSAFIYAALPSIGGGLFRDIIFGQRPVDLLTTPLYMVIVCSTVLIGFSIAKLIDKIEQTEGFEQRVRFYKNFFPHMKLALVICDALGLAAFTVLGVLASLAAKVEPLWLWGPFFSFLTGAGGTVIRDILIKSRKLADIEGEIYSEVAIIWGLFLSMGLMNNTYNLRQEYVEHLFWITVLGTFVTRLFVYFFKVKNVYFR